MDIEAYIRLYGSLIKVAESMGDFHSASVLCAIQGTLLSGKPEQGYLLANHVRNFVIDVLLPEQEKNKP
jgi:hypothetical protein